MNKQNIILDFEDIINTYSIRIPNKQLDVLNSRKWLRIRKGSKIASEFAYLVGKIIGDGHLDKRYVPVFIGQEKDIKNLRSHISNIFFLSEKKFSIRSRKAKGISYRLSVNDCLLGRALFCLGAPKGNKTKQEFLIPDWILNDKRSKKRFLQALLEDELITIKIEKCNYSVRPRLKLAKKEHLINNLREFMKQVKEAIESFGIECSYISNPIKSKGTNSLELYFHINMNKENIIRFAKNIGFRIHPEKVEHLDKCVKVLEKTKFNRKLLINKTKIMALRKKGLSIREISKTLNLNKSSVYRVLNKRRKKILLPY